MSNIDLLKSDLIQISDIYNHETPVIVHFELRNENEIWAILKDKEEILDQDIIKCGKIDHRFYIPENLRVDNATHDLIERKIQEAYRDTSILYLPMSERFKVIIQNLNDLL